MRPVRWSVLAVHLPLFLTLSAVWMIGLGLVLAIWMLTSGAEFVDPDALMDGLGAGGLGGFTILQMAGLAGLAAALSLLVSPTDPAEVSVPRDDVGARLRRAFPVSAPLLWLAVAFFGGLTIWTLPSFIAQELLPLLPDYPTTGELLGRMLRTAPLLGRATVILAIVGSAPLFEELIFRGYLWRVIEAGLGPIAALCGTTVLFALFHMDPVQSVALLPIAAFLGWLRMRSGSLLPSIAVHLMNNGLGVLLTLGSSSDSDEIGVGAAVGGAAFTVLAGAVGVWLSRRGRAPVAP